MWNLVHVKWTLMCLMIILTTTGSAQQPVAWTGEYSNDETGITLRIDPPQDGVYGGQVIFQGQAFPIRAMEQYGMLNGEYEYGGYWVAFTIAALEGTYYLTSEGVVLPLVRKAAAQTGVVAEPVTASPVQEKTGDRKPVTPATGRRLSDPYGGFSFQQPAGWEVTEQQGGYLLSKTGEQARLAAGPHNFRDMQAALAQTVEPVQDANSNTFLTPSLMPHDNNTVRLRLEGHVQGNALIIETLNVFSPHGGGASFLAFIPGGQSIDPYLALLASMAETVQFKKPEISAETQGWVRRLTGNQLLYLKTEGGGTERTYINLFADGSYYYHSQSSYFSGGYSDFSYAGRNKDQGTWKIVSRGKQSVLLLFSNDGSTGEHLLEQGQNAGQVCSNNRCYFIQPIQ